jgi:hypothetical protein
MERTSNGETPNGTKHQMEKTLNGIKRRMENIEDKKRQYLFVVF